MTRDERILANQGLVGMVARRFLDRGLEMADLCQFGQFGLMIAADRFDESRGYQFSTYATPWVWQSIRRGVAATQPTRAVPIPSWAWERVASFRRKARALAGPGGRPPPDRVVMEAIGITTPTRRASLSAALRVSRAEIGPIPPDHVTGHPRSGPEDVAERLAADELHARLGPALAALDPEDRDLVVMCFGLDGGRAMTAPYAARKLGISIRTAERRLELALRQIERYLTEDDDRPRRKHA